MVEPADLLRRRHGQGCDFEIRRPGRAGHRRRGRGQQLHGEIHNYQLGPVGHARPAPHTVLSHPASFAGLSRSETDRRPHQPPDQRHRCHPELHRVGVARGADQQPDAGGHDGRHVLPEPAVHADRAFRGAAAVRGRLPLHPPHQEGDARGAEKGRRDGLGDPGSAVVDARGEGFRARRITNSGGWRRRAGNRSRSRCRCAA